LKYPLLFGCVALVFACGRHAVGGSDPFDAPVVRDTIAYSSLMDEQLRNDSIEQNEAYFLRINRVKRVEGLDSSSRTVHEFDRFGHELQEKVYVHGELLWEAEAVYNRYGHKRSGSITFYYGARQASSATVSEYQYISTDTGRTERLKEMIATRYDYENEQSVTTRTRYEYRDGRVANETVFTDGRCTKQVYNAYAANGMLASVRTLYFTINDPDSSLKTFRYDAQHRVTGWALIKDGALAEDAYYEYDSLGRQSKYRVIDYAEYDEYIFGYSYLPNGLLAKSTITVNGKVTTELYRYTYY
jgi:hypothetical protein